MSRAASSLEKLQPRKLHKPFVCASCSFRRALSTRAGTAPKRVHPPRLLDLRVSTFLARSPTCKRYATTTSSVTSVNVPRSTPPAFRKLDQALAALEKEAAVYVNTSQLRLALRGLESEDAITRIASMFRVCSPVYRSILMKQ